MSHVERAKTTNNIRINTFLYRLTGRTPTMYEYKESAVFTTHSSMNLLLSPPDSSMNSKDVHPPHEEWSHHPHPGDDAEARRESKEEELHWEPRDAAMDTGDGDGDGDEGNDRKMKPTIIQAIVRDDDPSPINKTSRSSSGGQTDAVTLEERRKHLLVVDSERARSTIGTFELKSSDDDDDDDDGEEEEEEDDRNDGDDPPYHLDLIRSCNELTFEERQNALHDLHGVGYENEIHETPELMEHALAQVRHLLEEKRRSNTSSKKDDDGDLHHHESLLRLADVQYPDRIRDSNFLLMFLRADDFDAGKAVDRIMLHLTEQQILFGDDKVGKKITVDDFGGEDLRALENGHFQILAEKDRAGRMVIFDSIQHRNSNEDFSLESLLRVGFYTLMAGLEGDETVQRRGIVVVLSYLGNFRRSFGKRKSNESDFKKATRMFRSIPVKNRGTHGCMNPNKVIGAFDHFIRLGRKPDYARWRIHQGSFTECKYVLLSFGIPVHCIPLEEDLSLKREGHLQWIERRREIELLASNVATSLEDGTTMTAAEAVPISSVDAIPFHHAPASLIANPAPFDIIFGRGKSVQRHTGNVILNSMVEAMLGKYNSLERKKDKTMLSRIVVSKVKESGARFLKPSSSHDPNMWEEADDDAAQTKVGHIFRSLRYREKTRSAGQRSSGTMSSTSSSVDVGSGNGFFSSSCWPTSSIGSSASSGQHMTSDDDAGFSPTTTAQESLYRWTNL